MSAQKEKIYFNCNGKCPDCSKTNCKFYNVDGFCTQTSKIDFAEDFEKCGDIYIQRNKFGWKHEHYCEEKLFCGNKKYFNCKNKVKFKNAGHDDCCDFCNRMITVNFDDNVKDYYRTIAIYRMND